MKIYAMFALQMLIIILAIFILVRVYRNVRSLRTKPVSDEENHEQFIMKVK